MADQPRDNYEIEPDSGIAPQEDLPKPRQVGIPRPEYIEPLNVEEPHEEPRRAPGDQAHRAASDQSRRAQTDESRKSSVKDLDVCPSCGATMRGADNLVCIRCGFDLKTMRHVQTKTGEIDAAEAAAQQASGELQPLIKRGNGDLWLPTILAAVAGIILLIGYLAGARALFPNVIATNEAGQQLINVTAGMRLNAILKTLILIGMIGACGMGALAFTAYLNGMRLARNWDDLKLGVIRMLAIVVTMRLAAFIALPNRALEWTAETIVQLAIFAGLSIALFRIKPGDSPILTGAAVILFVMFWLAAYVVVWATW
jgi:hypothetical protein